MAITNTQRLVGLAHFGFDLADLPDRKPQTSIGIPIALLKPTGFEQYRSKQLCDECDREISRLVLGQSLTNGSTQHDRT